MEHKLASHPSLSTTLLIRTWGSARRRLAICFPFAKSRLPLRGGHSDAPFLNELITLMIRFVGALLLNYVDPALVLAFFGCCCSIFSILVSQLPKYGGIVCLFFLFFFESICYPCIFTLGTKNLGVHTKRGSGLIVMVDSFRLDKQRYPSHQAVFRVSEVEHGTHLPKVLWLTRLIPDVRTSYRCLVLLP